MVASKRCKICTTIEATNMPITGEYFGKQIEDMIKQISGVELDPRKVADVLICQQCVMLLVYTESVVSKFRKSLLRLKKPEKATKNVTKTPSKLQEPGGTVTPKKKAIKKSPATVKINGDISFKKISDDTIALDDSLLNDEVTPAKKKKNAKRKLDTHTIENNGNAIELSMDENKQEIPDDSTNKIEFEESTTKQKKRKTSTSVSINETILDRDETDINGTGSGTSKVKVLDCVLCGKKFNQKSLLREHIEKSHMGEKLKECPNCSMEFRSLQKYESHVFGEKCKSTLHPCQFENCHKRFKNVSKMEAHMREKHRPEVEADL